MNGIIFVKSEPTVIQSIKEEEISPDEVEVKDEISLSAGHIFSEEDYALCSFTEEIMESGVKYLQTVNFSQLTLSERMEIIARGRPTPVLSITQTSMSRNKEYARQFNISVYQKYEWLCGCGAANSLFCFPCLLFGGDSSWTKSGVADLKRLPYKIMRHERTAQHMHNMLDLSMLRKVNIAAQIDTGLMLSVAKHNEQVRKNRDVLSKIINCIKFCGKFELPLSGYDESLSSHKVGMFHELLDFACELDPNLDVHLKTATFFNGISQSLQNELLEAMLEICKNKIKEEVINADYLAVMCDEVTDIYDKSHMVIVLRYLLQGKPTERFWGCFSPINTSSEAFSSVLLEELETLIGECPHKLIAQTYDGAVALSGVNNGVQTRIKEVYSNAHFIHCYAHQLDYILEKATSQNTKICIFFNRLSGIPAFFSNSPHRTAALENVAAHRIPRSSAKHCNFKIRTVNNVHEMKDTLIECFSALEASNSRETGFAAASVKNILTDPEFEFWLIFFSKMLLHVDIMFSHFQSRNIDTTIANVSLEVFSSAVQKLKNEYGAIVIPHEQKRRKYDRERMTDIKEACDIILLQCVERFSFINHLEASKLLSLNNFQQFAKKFPNKEFARVVESYPMLEKDKLRTELTVLYARKDLCKSESLIDLLGMMNERQLQSTFTNTVKLLQVLITTPMTTAEAERCFSTLKSIKIFFQNTMVTEGLSALAMISIEKKFILEMKDFNEKVINHFASSKSLHTDFILK